VPLENTRAPGLRKQIQVKNPEKGDLDRGGDNRWVQMPQVTTERRPEGLCLPRPGAWAHLGPCSRGPTGYRAKLEG
jgi:hypothetical protein